MDYLKAISKKMPLSPWFVHIEEEARPIKTETVPPRRDAHNSTNYVYDVNLRRGTSKKKGVRGQQRVRVVIVSDTHARLADVKVPAGDILIHCGDAGCARNSRADVLEFNRIMGTLPHKHKIFVGGNHEMCLNESAKEESTKVLDNMTYLQDDLVDVMGVKIYGAPWLPKRGWGPMNAYKARRFNKSLSELKRLHNMIPGFTEDSEGRLKRSVDILVTHGPPYGVMDEESIGHTGSISLLESVLGQVKPLVHCFGHVHENAGVKRLLGDDGSGTMFVNAAICNKEGLRDPIVLDIYVDSS